MSHTINVTKYFLQKETRPMEAIDTNLFVRLDQQNSKLGKVLQTLGIPTMAIGIFVEFYDMRPNATNSGLKYTTYFSGLNFLRRIEYYDFNVAAQDQRYLESDPMYYMGLELITNGAVYETEITETEFERWYTINSLTLKPPFTPAES